jgi:hypothetical protein
LAVFKIARAGLSQSHSASSYSLGESGQELLSQFCFSEGWSGDLSNGLFRLGESAAAMHGLQQTECCMVILLSC